MTHKTDMREALQLCIDAMLHDGVPIDPYHPRRVALAAAENALASRPDAQESLASENVAKDSPPKVSQGLAQADERGAFEAWVVTDDGYRGSTLDRCLKRGYAYSFVEGAWRGWQARAAAPQPAFEAVQAVLREVDPKWRERGEFGVKPHEQAIAAIRDLAAAAPQAAPVNGIPATLRHDEGAIARCSYCGRYSIDPKTLSDRQPACDCGERHGWSGSFEKPGRDAKWNGEAPTTAPQAEAAQGAPESWKLVPIEPTAKMRARAADAYLGSHGYGDAWIVAVWNAMLAAAPSPDREQVGEAPEGCTPTDAEMLRAANHALAAEIDRLKRRLRPFAQLASSPLSWAMVEYCIKDDPEKQTFQAPQMQRAFNRAAEALAENTEQQPMPMMDFGESGLVAEMLEALEAVVSVADRATIEFDKARAAIERARTALNAGASPSRECGERQECPHGQDDGACGWCYDEKVASAPTLGEPNWRERFYAEQQARMELEAALHQVVGDAPAVTQPLTDEQIEQIATATCYVRTAAGGWIFSPNTIGAFARALLENGE